MSGKATSKPLLSAASAATTAAVAKTNAEPDAQLLSEFMQDVQPLRKKTRPATEVSAKPKPIPRFHHADEAQVMQDAMNPAMPELSSGSELAWHADSVSRKVWRRLQRGEYRVDAEVDLHGLSAIKARDYCKHFLLEAIDRNAGCVRIVHGKGLRSGSEGPVLKNMVDGLLRQNNRVLAFSSAPRQTGGNGAVLVLLKR